MKKYIKKNLFFLLIIFICSIAKGQENEMVINKIIISNDELVYYSKGHNIYNKSSDMKFRLLRFFHVRRNDFGDYEENKNFIIINKNLLTLTFGKRNSIANSKEEFWRSPWVASYKYINLTNIDDSPIVSPIIQLDDRRPLCSQNPIFYDFFEHKNDIFLMILANHTLYLYQSAGSLDENQWQLKKTFSGLKYQSFFRAYKEDSCNLILDFGSDESYCIDLENESATLIEIDPHENKCLVHNQLTNEFLWLTPTQAKELIAEDDPVMYINQFKQE